MEAEKRPYMAPKLVVYGDMTAITQGSRDGESLDASFPAGTLKRDLTFS